ncbi:hypothetical protein [Pseudosporangium ferrugineum]|uniref:Uncharacterized protein n=1 Tax=Pseudosporangium ferrugineum TaxID=439699 RepID=A0A2T0SAY9_9ACTN|nr:hypothetical protein [Pseudosporangium ferrugineum]PRY30483.1 hypothetical protein CLV70_10435 [Pseudosporangium ferrugineum]
MRNLRALLALFSTLALAPATAAMADDPPGGRRNFVVALMRNVGTESFVRLAQYSLRADGTVRADYWAWNAQTAQLRADAGYSTADCARTCRVYTSEGFQDDPARMFGRWTVTGNNLGITWDANGEAERWTLANHAGASRVSLASHPRATVGYGWGSTFGFTGGVPMQTIHDLHGRYDGPYSQNAWGEQTAGTTTLVIHANDANVPDRTCSGTCLNESTYNGTALSNKVYLAGSGTDRKVFYNHQLAEVDATPCIGGNTAGYAGHLKPSLSIIDDAGRFRGLLSVQAVTYNQTAPGNILGIYDQNDLV